MKYEQNPQSIEDIEEARHFESRYPPQDDGMIITFAL